MDAEIVRAAPEHIAPIAADARQADVDELWAQARATPAECMTRGLRASHFVATGLVDGVPVCMFGVAPYSILRGQGVPWMVGTNLMLRHQKALLRESRVVVAAMQELYPLLFNAVDDRNEAAKRWLHWLGFTLLDPVPSGIGGELFRPFYLER